MKLKLNYNLVLAIWSLTNIWMFDFIIYALTYPKQVCIWIHIAYTCVLSMHMHSHYSKSWKFSLIMLEFNYLMVALMKSAIRKYDRFNICWDIPWFLILKNSLVSKQRNKNFSRFSVHALQSYAFSYSKSLSSLKQVLRMWYHQFDSYIQQLGYNWSDSDLCMHIRQLADKSWIYMILYVDDMLIAESDEAEIKKLNG